MSHSKLFIIFFLFFFFTTFASSISLNNNIHKCSKEQSEALLLFKQNSFSFNYALDWNASTDCCNWNGVTCDHSNGDVIGIDLALHNFDGSEIPREIGNFSNSLTHLNLSDCGFSGEVPTDITLLHKLVSLDLSSNSHLYIRPDVFINLIQNFTNFEELSLGNVDISFVLPTSINISSSLKLLKLPFTRLEGKLPNYIFNLRSLETLDLAGNSLTGDIPSDISINLTHLTHLDLSSNQLTGTLPSWLFTSPSLEYLNLRFNMFTGNVPFHSFALPSLQRLDLSNNNQLRGQIDMKTFRQLTNLTAFSLSYNNFSGECELDTLLSSLRNLEYLDLSYSGFSVTTKNDNHYVNRAFKTLGLASCKLKEFPNSLQAMKQLQWLDLSSNVIDGQIPHWAGEIGGNELFLLNISHNLITGFPKFQWYRLEYLYLQHNLIQGPFPPSICSMSMLRLLDMSNNRFGGLIPQCIGNITSSIERMDLGTNQLQGPFPPSICSMSNLGFLDMSHNGFNGVIPQCVRNISSSLTLMDLGSNFFQGTIPNVFEEFRQLEGLILNGNQFEGGVPRSLSKCQQLRVLDLGNNSLHGTFRGWLGDLPNLQALVLKSNNFHGHIQPSATVEVSFPSLRVLDLSHNGFVGQLPAKYFQYFSSMKNVDKSNTGPQYVDMGGKDYSVVVAVKGVNLNFPRISVDYTIIDLSQNKFEGYIPNVVCGLHSLIVLNLSHNSLIGPIPHDLGNLTEIESLDLSWNQLSEEIPQSLARITNLEVLNLSQNHLEGRIPGGPQFSGFSDSFGGNAGLYGFPLPNREHRSSPQVEDDDDEEESGFTWKVVMLGHGCGTIIGLVIGYLMLSTTRPNWLNAIADAGEHMILKRRNKRRCTWNVMMVGGNWMF